MSAYKVVRSWQVCAFALLSFLGQGRLQAQETSGTFRGSVTDASGARVRNALIKATQSDIGLTREVTTGGEGEYTLALLPVGRYRIEVQAKGFETYVREGVQLNVNEIVTLDFPLVLGSQRQLVEIVSDATSVATSNDLGQTVERRQIVDLPLNGRNFTQLGLLQPGVAPLTQGPKNAGGPLRAMQAYAVKFLESFRSATRSQVSYREHPKYSCRAADTSRAAHVAPA